MSEPELDKTIPAVLDAKLRPRRMARIHGTVARSRAEGAWFDALLWTVFALVLVLVLLALLHVVDTRGIDEKYIVAGGVLVVVMVAGLLWWRWFKWQVHATVDAVGNGFDPSSQSRL
jgi:protein-S-isoprenylcysteine O-methyltransferase Ste14